MCDMCGSGERAGRLTMYGDRGEVSRVGVFCDRCYPEVAGMAYCDQFARHDPRAAVGTQHLGFVLAEADGANFPTAVPRAADDHAYLLETSMG